MALWAGTIYTMKTFNIDILFLCPCVSVCSIKNSDRVTDCYKSGEKIFDEIRGTKTS